MTRREAWHLIFTAVLLVALVMQQSAISQLTGRVMEDELAASELDTQVRAQAQRLLPELLTTEAGSQGYVLRYACDGPRWMHPDSLDLDRKERERIAEVRPRAPQGIMLGQPIKLTCDYVICDGSISTSPVGYTITCSRCGAHSP